MIDHRLTVAYITDHVAESFKTDGGDRSLTRMVVWQSGEIAMREMVGY